MSGEPIASRFPLVHPNGVRWTDFTGHCGGCSANIPIDELRGDVTHPFASVFVVDVEASACATCGTATRFRYRLHDDLSISGRSPLTGEWSIWKTRKKRSWWRRAWAWLTEDPS